MEVSHELQNGSEWGFDEEEMNHFKNFKVILNDDSRDCSNNLQFKVFGEIEYIYTNLHTDIGKDINDLFKIYEQKEIINYDLNTFQCNYGKKRNEDDLNMAKLEVSKKIDDLV